MTVDRYIRSIRNAEKKRYAQAYALFLTGRGARPAERSYNLSAMGRQAVEMQLGQLSQ